MKFKYGDTVRISKGFYRGHKGRIIGTIGWWFCREYLIMFKGSYDWVYERDLELV